MSRSVTFKRKRAVPGTQRATPRLDRTSALRIINALPFLVASSTTLLEVGTIVTVPYEVEEQRAFYTFDPQPFRIMRQLTYSQYREALPKGLRTMRLGNITHYFYEISTD